MRMGYENIGYGAYGSYQGLAGDFKFWNVSRTPAEVRFDPLNSGIVTCVPFLRGVLCRSLRTTSTGSRGASAACLVTGNNASFSPLSNAMGST